MVQAIYSVKQQHGFIDSVGFDLYSNVRRSSKRKRGIKEESPDAPDIEVELHLDVPAEYTK